MLDKIFKVAIYKPVLLVCVANVLISVFILSGCSLSEQKKVRIKLNLGTSRSGASIANANANAFENAGANAASFGVMDSSASNAHVKKYQILGDNFFSDDFLSGFNGGNMYGDVSANGNANSNMNRSKKVFGNGFRNRTTAPSTVDDFTCLGVNVMGSGIGMAVYSDQFEVDDIYTQGSCSIYPGVISGLVSPTSGEGSVSLEVPTGPSRVIQVLGYQTTFGCPDNDTLLSGILDSMGSTEGGGTNTGPIQGVYELGRSVVDLYTDTDVTIYNSYDPLTSVNYTSCHGSNMPATPPTINLTCTNIGSPYQSAYPNYMTVGQSVSYTYKKLAQSFFAMSTFDLRRVQVAFKPETMYANGATSVTVSIYSNVASLPGVPIDSVNVAVTSSTMTLYDVTFASNIPITSGNQYWIVVEPTSGLGDVSIGSSYMTGNGPYVNGTAYNYNGSTWFPSSGDDIAFFLFSCVES